MPLVDWPKEIPDQALIDVTHLSKRAIRILGNTYHHQLINSFNPANRAHVGVYHCPDGTLSGPCTLWRSGIGLQEIKVPIPSPGLYYLITIAPYGSFVQVLTINQAGAFLSDRIDKVMQILE
jgi:hypothetical protein